MARTFDGVDDLIVCSAGSLVGVGNGAVTIAIIVKVNDTSKDGAVIYCGGTDLSGVSLELFSGSWYGSSQGPSMASASTSDNWTLIAYTKAAGTVTPRFHKYVYGTASWTHSNAGGTHDNGVAVQSGDNLQMGKWGSGSDRCAVDLALGGVWSRQLTDDQIQQLAFSLQAWYAASPVEAWPLDQASTSQAVRSWSGSSVQTSITGTSVSTSSVPVFSYGFPVLVPHSVPASGGTTYNQSVSGSCTASGAVAKQTNRTLSGSSTAASSVAKRLARTLAGTAAASGLAAKQTASTLTASATSTGALTKRAARTLTGSATSSATIVKQPRATKSGSSAASGNAIRAVAHLLAGSCTSSGSPVKQTATGRTGSITAASALSYSRVVLKTLTGSVTAAGAVARQIGKALAGNVTGSAAIRRAVTVTRSGSLTAAGAVLKLTSRLLGGTVQPSGALVSSGLSEDTPGRHTATMSDSRLAATTTATSSQIASTPTAHLTATTQP